MWGLCQHSEHDNTVRAAQVKHQIIHAIFKLIREFREIPNDSFSSVGTFGRRHSLLRDMDLVQAALPLFLPDRDLLRLLRGT